ncbi:MAG: hypothetical protein HRF42_11010 [Candidatus Brocadia sp.]|jgi:hypothetical protein
MYRYLIGGKTYIQKPLVLGQWRQLLDLLKDLKVPQDFDIREIVSAFGDKLPYALAIVLIEEGKPLREKDIGALASQIEFEISPESTFQIIEDFFACNPMPLLLNRLSGMMQKLIPQDMTETGLTNSASSSRMAISPNETKSYGDIPSPSASHI